MTAYVTDCRQVRWTLPRPVAWRLEYTAGAPCDSFWLRCVWEENNTTRPADWVSFTAEHEGERVFTGLVDECEVSITDRGRLLEVSGRAPMGLPWLRGAVCPPCLSSPWPPGAASGRWSMSLPGITAGSPPGLTGRDGWC